MIKFEDMIETISVKEGDDYLNGWYNNKVAVHGYKLRVKPKTLLEQLEIKAKGKFKLENDAENYAQEARILLYEMIEKYYKLHDCDDDSEVAKWLYTAVDRKLIDLAKALKGGFSYYDRSKGEYIINQIEYFGEYADGSILEGYINNLNESSMNKSKTDFLRWFDANKQRILTKKQLAYLNNDEVDLKNITRLHRNIINRVDKAYHDATIRDCKLTKQEFKMHTVRELLDCLDLERLQAMLIDIDTVEDCEFIIDELFKELSMSDCKVLTSVLKNEIKIEKKMYYKLLGVLINLETKLEKLYNP